MKTVNQVSIRLPKMGESVADATLSVWLKQVGDNIEKDEIICEIGTDKVDSELPSEYSGVLKEIFVQEGQTVHVSDVIAIIETEDEIFEQNSLPQFNSAQDEEVTFSKKPQLIDKNEVGFLSPVVRKMVAQHQITAKELNTLKGSGQNNRIRKIDIEQFLKNKERQLAPKTKFNLEISPGDEVKTLTRTRQVIAKNMLESSQWIPHVTTFVDINVSHLVILRNNLKEHYLENNLKITYTHILMYEIVQSLKAFPQLNSWLDENEWVIKKDIHLGFATALPNGNLVVPNIKCANIFEVEDFVKSVATISKKARANKLQPEDYLKTTFTVTNTGIFGSVMGTPIISAPQVAVLALGSIQRRPVVNVINGEEQLGIGDVMYASISYDHRVIDGALASKFLSHLKTNIEQLKCPVHKNE